MIEFVTLLLGLVAGPQTVEVAVGEPVTAVELRLDHQVAATLAGPPWRAEVDFGTELLPRRLEAVALDADGAELERAVLLLNRPRADAEVRVALEDGPGGKPVAARLTWESLSGRLPLRVRALFDGEPLAVLDPARVSLPPYDPAGLHVFQVEMDFAGDVVARAHAAFGGAYVDDVRSDLSALPVELRKKARKVSAAAAAGWFAQRGEPIEVVGVERGPAEVVVVRGAGVAEALAGIEGQTGAGVGPGNVGSATGLVSIPQATAGVYAGPQEQLRQAAALDADVRMHLLLPRARRVERGPVAYDLFAALPDLSAEQGGLYWLLQRGVTLPGLAEEERLADAVANAGVRAAAADRRRAVVLVLATSGGDASQFAAASVRRYLAALSVPLVIWQIESAETPAPTNPSWPADHTIRSLSDLRRASRDLQDALDRQRIVWLAGTHLPEEVALVSGAPAERLR